MTDETHPAADDEVVTGEVIDPGPADTGLELPEDAEEAVTVLVGELMDTRAIAESRLEDLQRLAAEFENFRKRVDRDRDELLGRATQGLIERLLPVLDTFDAAIATAGNSGDAAVLDGMESTRQQLLDALADDGLAVVGTEAGDEFDPSVHEAVSGGGTGHLVVTQVLRRGYTLSDRLLRAALVQVAAEDVSGDTNEG